MAHVEEEPRKVQYPLDSNCYELVDEIGRGVSAVVYKAACAAMNSPEAAMVAIKCIDLERSRTDLDKARREAQTMFLLSHPNVLGAYCSFTVDHSLWVVMPFMSGGSLRSIMSSSFPDGLSEPCIAVILRETLSALAYLHGQGHLHRDVKAGNILIDSNGSVKLADFGVSASVYEAAAGAATAMLTDMAGTPYWMAPEVVHSHVGYSFKADIWSFGITALELAHGRPPLSHLPPCKSLMMKITKRFRFSDHYQKTRSSKGKKFSKSFKHMVGLCLDQDPSKRPSAEKLLKHPFFKTCKGSEFLAKNILQGLPSVEQRYKLEAQLQRLGSTKRTEEDAGNEDEEFPARGSPKQRRISGWNFNEDVFELDPVFPTTKELVPTESSDIVKQVRFGGESIIQDKKANSNPNSPKEAAEVGQREGEPSRQDGGTDRSPMLEGLVVLKKSLDAQRRRVACLIALFTGEEAEEELVERLKTELENEKAKNSQLENQVEFLESQLAIAYTLLDSS